jgi:ATP-dependent Zn protease
VTEARYTGGMNSADEATAYHEAGHAVMALALGRTVSFVTIRPDRRHLGICEFGKPVLRPTEDWLEREMLIALAGLAAEAMRTGEYAWEEAGKDRDYALDLAEKRAGNARQAERLERRVLSKAEHLLAKPAHWRAVERLAGELLRQGEVSGRAARHIFEDELRRDH